MAKTELADSNRKALRAGIGYSVGNYLIKAVSFAAVPLFARLLGPGDYGLFGVFSSYESILFLIAGLSIHCSFRNAKLRYVTGDGARELYDRYVSDAALLILLLCSLLFAVFTAFRGRLSALLGLPVPALYLLLLYSSGAALLSCWYERSSLEYDCKRHLAASAAYGVGSILFSLLLILTLFRKSPALGRMSGTALAAALPAAVIAVLFFRRARPGDMLSLLPWGILYSLPLIPGGISQIVLAEFDRIMILRMTDASSAGIYSMAFNLFIIGNVGLQSLESVWVPWFYEQLRAGRHGRIRHAAKACTLLMAAFYAVLILLSPELIRILGGRAFRDALYCALPVLCGGFCTFLCMIFSTPEYFHAKTLRNAAATVVSAALNVLLNLVCIRRFGYMAAGYTTLFSYLLQAVIHYGITARLEPARELYPLKEIAALFCFVCASALFTGIFPGAVALRVTAAGIVCLFCLIYEERRYRLLRKWLKKD